MKVFLSYSRRDADFVDRLKGDLDGRGYDVWVDREDIVGDGEDRWRRSIVRAIRNSDVVILVLSPNSAMSENVERELSVAADNGRRLIPVLYRECQMPDGFAYELSGLQHVDFSTLEFDEAMRQLSAQLGPAGAPTAVDTGASRRAAPPTRIVTPNEQRGDDGRRQRRLLLVGVCVLVLAMGAIVLASTMGGGDAGSLSSASSNDATVQPQATPSITLSTPSLTTPPPVSNAATGVTTPPGRPVVQSVSASVVRSNGTDSCGNPTQYQPANVHDGRNDTAWMAPGDGVGATLTFDLGQPSIVTTVGLIPGYDKVDPCTGSDRFSDLRQVTKVLWSFDDGTSAQQMVASAARMQYLDLPRAITTTRVTMKVLETSEPGDSRLDYTPVSEVEIL